MTIPLIGLPWAFYSGFLPRCQLCLLCTHETLLSPTGCLAICQKATEGPSTGVGHLPSGEPGAAALGRPPALSHPAPTSFSTCAAPGIVGGAGSKGEDKQARGLLCGGLDKITAGLWKFPEDGQQPPWRGEAWNVWRWPGCPENSVTAAVRSRALRAKGQQSCLHQREAEGRLHG